MLSLRICAALTALLGLGFGAPIPFVATRLLRSGKLPTFFGLFPMYGGTWFGRCSSERFVLLLALFLAICAADLFAGWLVWDGSRAGAWLTIALLPLEATCWYGFTLPIPPLISLVRFACLAIGWASLR